MPDSGTLVIGLNDNTTSDPNYHRWVSERWWELPWFVDHHRQQRRALQAQRDKYIEFVGDVHVINPEYWFAGLPNLEKADVAHMHIDVAGSIEGLFGTLPRSTSMTLASSTIPSPSRPSGTRRRRAARPTSSSAPSRVSRPGTPS